MSLSERPIINANNPRGQQLGIGLFPNETQQGITTSGHTYLRHNPFPLFSTQGERQDCQRLG